MDIQNLIFFHTVLSFIGMGIGIPVMILLLKRIYISPWILAFLSIALALTITGFMLPIEAITPAVAVGVLALLTLILACLAQYKFKLSGLWGRVFTFCVTLNVYLLYFVAVAQAFMKIEALNSLAPTLSEPPFGISQLFVLLVFGVLGVKIFRRT